MLQVKRELCSGCGLCSMICPQNAITLYQGKAEIDQKRCIICYQCTQICPQTAIREEEKVTIESLKAIVEISKQELDVIISRIKKLENSLRLK